MDENKKNKLNQEVKERKITAKRVEINQKEQLSEPGQSEFKENVIDYLILCIFLLPFFALVIAQFVHGKFSVFNIFPLILIVGIIINAFRKPKNKKNVRVTGQYNESRINSDTHTDDGKMIDEYTDELKEKWKISNVNQQPNTNINDNQKHFAQSETVIRIFAGIFVLIFAVLSFVSFKFLVLDITKGSKIYDAEVIKIIDQSTNDVYYDETDETWTVAENTECKVTFKYFDGTQYVTVDKVFYGVSGITEKHIKIYIKDGEVMGTENILISGRFLTIYLLIMAVVILFVVFLPVEHLMILVTSILFSGVGLVAYIPLKISPKEIFYSPPLAIVAMLACIGWFFFFYAFRGRITQMIAYKKAQNQRENNQ